MSTFLRVKTLNGKKYLYWIKSIYVPETGKYKQESTYLGIAPMWVVDHFEKKRQKQYKA